MRSVFVVSAGVVALVATSVEAWVLLPSTAKNAVSGINTNRTVWPYASKCCEFDG